MVNGELKMVNEKTHSQFTINHSPFGRFVTTKRWGCSRQRSARTPGTVSTESMKSSACRKWCCFDTQEQLNQLEQRGRQLGEEQIREGEAAWKELHGQFRAEMEKGTDPASETVQRLAEKQRDLVQAFTGGDPAMAQSLKTMYEQEGPVKASRGMIDPEVGAYMAKAMAAARKDQ